MLRTIAISLLISAASLSGASARAADVANRPTLTLDGAKAVATFAIHYAREHQAPGAAVAMVDSGARCSMWNALMRHFKMREYLDR